jgi:monoamine oxidase
MPTTPPIDAGRRRLLGAVGGAALLPACSREPAVAPLQGGFVGPAVPRGHRLRELKSGALPTPAVQRRAGALVIGGGIAGLAAARGLMRAGFDDVQLLELEDQPGGNSRGHSLAGLDCPLGAHYLPLPGPQAHEVREWLFEIGLLRHELGRTVADERHLCHSPQERLWFEGEWIEGVLPPAAPGSARLAQYRSFAGEVRAAQRLGFALPSLRAPWTSAHAALDTQTFAAWLDARGLVDPALRWFLDYSCRDDYGAAAAEVSAWAGLHYFASRHGFAAPGDEEHAHEAVFTWPEGNAWLVQRLAAPLGARLHGGMTVLRITETRHEVEVLAWNEAAAQAERWRAPLAVLAVPLFVAARLLQDPPAALRQAAAQLPQAPWLVANLLLDGPLATRPGAPPAWDNVVYGDAGLGYVEAGHQRLAGALADREPRVITSYHALPRGERGTLLQAPWSAWAAQVQASLGQVHPDLPQRLRRIELMRHGHGMAIPTPGVRGSAALAALRAPGGRLRFAHADLAGYSVFEEAFTAGCRAAAGPGARA